jgi:hydroxymethylpyrimidine kinase/phosphomethylpyrimidine kinase
MVAGHLAETGIQFVLDPVIEAEAGGRLLKPEAVDALISYLIPQAKVVTPNIFEASSLTGIEVKDLQSAEQAARRIADLGAGSVIVKGGHLDCIDILLEEGEFFHIKGQRVTGGNHGVGCTYSAALTAFLGRGRLLREAAQRAQEFAALSIKNSFKVGRGVDPVNQAGAFLNQ